MIYSSNDRAAFHAGRASGLAFALRLLATCIVPLEHGELWSCRIMFTTVATALEGARTEAVRQASGTEDER